MVWVVLEEWGCSEFQANIVSASRRPAVEKLAVVGLWACGASGSCSQKNPA